LDISVFPKTMVVKRYRRSATLCFTRSNLWFLFSIKCSIKAPIKPILPLCSDMITLNLNEKELNDLYEEM
jgi:hypothetical protein